MRCVHGCGVTHSYAEWPAHDLLCTKAPIPCPCWRRVDNAKCHFSGALPELQRHLVQHCDKHIAAGTFALDIVTFMTSVREASESAHTPNDIVRNGYSLYISGVFIQFIHENECLSYKAFSALSEMQIFDIIVTNKRHRKPNVSTKVEWTVRVKHSGRAMPIKAGVPQVVEMIDCARDNDACVMNARNGTFQILVHNA